MKQAILIRNDLKMPKGKLAAQVAHASLEAAIDSSVLHDWRADGSKKVVLKVADMRELKKYIQLVRAKGIQHAIITDAARTFFKRPTVTCLGIGPAEEGEVDQITKELKLV